MFLVDTGLIQLLLLLFCVCSWRSLSFQ